MRVLFLTEAYGVHEDRFLRYLASSPHEIWYQAAFPGRPTDRIPKNIQCLPTLFERRREASSLDAKDRLRRVLNKIRPEVVHAGPITTCGFWCAIARAEPLVLMSWGSDLLRPDLSWLDEKKNWYALQSARAALCDCETLRKSILQINRKLEDRIFVFPWGVELDQFRPGVPPLGIREARGWQKKRVGVSTRALEHRYGVTTLMEAAILALRSAPDLRFLVAGDGSMRAWCEQVATDSGNGEAFCFLGELAEEQMPRLFAEADVYVSCSAIDGTSISMLQAFACGLPVVVTEIPSNREWVEEGRNGWLVPPANAEACAERLAKCAAAEGGQLASMGRTNLRLAQERADWLTNSKVLLKAYDFVHHDPVGLAE